MVSYHGNNRLFSITCKKVNGNRIFYYAGSDVYPFNTAIYISIPHCSHDLFEGYITGNRGRESRGNGGS